jgi:hypothetical protein
MSSSLPPSAGLSWVQSLRSDNFVQIQMVFFPTITVIMGVAVLSSGRIDFFLFFFFMGATLFFITEGPMEIVVHCTRKWGRGSRQSVPDRCHFIGDIVSQDSEFHSLVSSFEVPVFTDNFCGTVRWPPGSCRSWWPGTKFCPCHETPST